MRYTLFGRSGLRVSELCLGTMTFGEDWGWGASKEESRQIFDRYVEAGGNFIDTSSNYTNGTAERYVGEFVRSDRDHFVVATKYSLSDRRDDPNFGGNHRKNLLRSLEGSLRRLGTDRVDILWLHMWDGMTPVEEVVRTFDDVVRSGKVLYVGFSDTPAWIVAQANTMAELRGWSRFVGLQLPYSLVDRSPERDLLPMARAFEMAVMAWGLLEGGVLTGKYRHRDARTATRYEGAGDRELAIGDAVVAVAEELGASPAQVAINWVRAQHHRAQVLPILGARTEAQLKDDLGCLDVELAPEHLRRLEEASPFSEGFPKSFLESDGVRGLIFGETFGQIDPNRPLSTGA